MRLLTIIALTWSAASLPVGILTGKLLARVAPSAPSDITGLAEALGLLEEPIPFDLTDRGRSLS